MPDVGWGSESSSMEQDKALRQLAHRVLGRDLMSKDLHDAYAHAGIGRPPALLPANLKAYQVDRLMKWLEDKQKGKTSSEDAPEPCLYCMFGCEECEPQELEIAN